MRPDEPESDRPSGGRLPSSIHNPLARGCHHLIRQGAKLVETAMDVLEEIAPQLNAWLQQDKPSLLKNTLYDVTAYEVTSADNLDPDYAKVLDALGYEAVAIDQTILNTGLTAETVSSTLLMLELQGLVAACGGGHYMRLSPRERIK